MVSDGVTGSKASSATVDANVIKASGGFQSTALGSGQIALYGLTSGTVQQTVQGNSGTWTFTWPVAPAGPRQWLTTDSAGNAFFSQPTAADIAPAGILPSAMLPAPTASTPGGVLAKNCRGLGHVVAVGTDGSITCSADEGSNITASQVTAALAFAPESTINKGQPNGYAPLDATGKIPAANLNLPSGPTGLDPTTTVIVDEFMPNANASSQIGQLGWTPSCAGAGASVTRLRGGVLLPSVGLYSLTSAGAANSYCAIELGGADAGPGLPNDFMSSGNWEMIFVIQMAYTYGPIVRAGVTGFPFGGAADLSRNSFVLEAAVGDHWFFKSFDASGNVTGVVDTGVPSSTGYTYRLRLFGSSPSAVQAQVNVMGRGNSTPVSLPSAILAQPCPGLVVKTVTPSSATVIVDYFGVRIGGLAR
jgi:hypothetical protein